MADVAGWTAFPADEAGNINASAFEVQVPAEAEPGDVLLLGFISYVTGAVIPPEVEAQEDAPPEVTLSGDWLVLYNQPVTGVTARSFMLAARTVAEGDPDSYTVTTTTPAWPVIVLTAIRGADPGDPAGWAAAFTGPGGTANVNPPAYDPGTEGAVIWCFSGVDSNLGANPLLRLPEDGAPAGLRNNRYGTGLGFVITPAGVTPGPATAAAPLVYQAAAAVELAPLPVPPEPEPPEPPAPPRTYRRYDRDYEPTPWTYAPRPRVSAPGRQIAIVWDGLPLNPGNMEDGSTVTVELVEGWDDGPPLAGHDADRAIADGAAWGPKTLQARHVVIHGAAVGDPDRLLRFRDQLSGRAAARQPAELGIGSRVALVRGGTELLRVHWHGPNLVRYEVALTAADPVLYDAEARRAMLGNVTGDTGRAYPRTYAWGYAQPYIGNSVLVGNDGNHPAPVFALYEGELTESRLTDGRGGIIRLAPLAAGMAITVATATLTAEAQGGSARASYILPGSRPMAVPAQGVARWHLYAAGSGTVTLVWRSAWV
jgi:hypothetical protein